jgi:CDGSH-type Zn-finger protein
MDDELNIVIVQIDGPNLATGKLAVVTETGVRNLGSAMLCRCGRSSDKPFCDGAHVKSGFKDPARMPADLESAAIGPGTLTIRPIPNGPLKCEGPLALRGFEGAVARSNLTFLCRCGESRNKPYCDGTHKKIGFRS